MKPKIDKEIFKDSLAEFDRGWGDSPSRDIISTDDLVKDIIDDGVLANHLHDCRTAGGRAMLQEIVNDTSFYLFSFDGGELEVCCDMPFHLSLHVDFQKLLREHVKEAPEEVVRIAKYLRKCADKIEALTDAPSSGAG